MSEYPCRLCGRVRNCTFHHLIPKKMHRKKWCKKKFTKQQLQAGILVCRDCHDAIHRFIPHDQLAKEWNSLEALQQHPKLASFIVWVSRQNRERRRTHRIRKQR